MDRQPEPSQGAARQEGLQPPAQSTAAIASVADRVEPVPDVVVPLVRASYCDLRATG
jgi:hypothetical protein